MRIGIDARFYGPVGKGLGRYTEKLVEYLEQAAEGDDRYFVFLRRENFDRYVPKNPGFTKVLADYPWYSFREQFLFPWILRKYRLDLVHFAHFNVPVLYRGRFIVTIHDLILLHFPTVRNTTKSRLTYGMKYLAYRLAISSAIRRAVVVLTVSRFTERDILSSFPGAAGKTVVTYEGCDFDAGSVAETGSEAPGSRAILEPYFLYVGNAYPHKNLDAFVPLAALFPEVRFVLVGKEDHFYRLLREKAESTDVGNVVFTGFVPDGELAELYRHAMGYVFPSLYEGFGLPPLEAMRFGIPVIAADRGSLPEILGDAAIFFDPDDPESLPEKVRSVLEDRDLAQEFARRGRERSGMFRWKDMAVSTLAAYRRAFPVADAVSSKKKQERLT
ncbi:MAG: glycosyltransferase family 4 protein [Candidatus Moranbacteria bacterium]|nr:glycosyltransferase family 4 protein [Candidatus Moranbacteria bacterium]